MELRWSDETLREFQQAWCLATEMRPASLHPDTVATCARIERYLALRRRWQEPYTAYLAATTAQKTTRVPQRWDTARWVFVAVTLALAVVEIAWARG